jgi:uncharacterized protein HemY
VRARSLLIVTAIISSLLGAVVAWLVLTVPNDLQAGVLLKSARSDIEEGENDKARHELSRIIQQYPRTDAAAAATVALATIADSERHALQSMIEQMKKSSAAQQKQLADLTTRVDTLTAAPPPQPVTVQAPPPAPKKKAAPHHSRRKRRR